MRGSNREKRRAETSFWRVSNDEYIRFIVSNIVPVYIPTVAKEIYKSALNRYELVISRLKVATPLQYKEIAHG